MKFYFSLIIISLSFSVYGQKWEKIIDYDGKFSLKTPNELTEKQDTVDTAIGEIVYHTYYYQDPKGVEAHNLFYMMSYCDYPEGSVHSDSTDLLVDFFDSTMETAAKSVNGRLIYYTDDNINGYPGKLWRVEYLDGKAIIKTRAFVVNNRYYAIQIITLNGKSINDLSDAFLYSFRLLE